MIRTPSRRTVLALATGSLVLGGLAAPAVAASAPVATDTEHFCVYTRTDSRTGERDGFCVWIPDVVPATPSAGS